VIPQVALGLGGVKYALYGVIGALYPFPQRHITPIVSCHGILLPSASGIKKDPH
jgi:hypothetical protein